MGRKGFLIMLAVMAVLAAGPTSALATTAFSVRSDVDDNLYRIDLESGTATAIGPVGFGDVEGLAFDPGGRLFGFDDTTNQLIRIDTSSGAGTAVGPSGLTVTDMGLDFGCTENVFMSVDAPQDFFRIDAATGAGTLIGPQGIEVTGLASDGQTLFGLSGDNTNQTVTVNPQTGAATPVGSTGIDLSDGGLAAAPDGRIWGISDAAPGPVFTLDKQTGAATIQFDTGLGGFEGLAIDAPSVCYPPGVTITAGPDGPTNDTTPTFAFHVSPEAPANDGMTVACVLNAPEGPCSDDATSHTPSAPLSDGFYRFTVGATARDGITGVAERSFRVDTDPPKAGFQDRPKRQTHDRTPKATFRSDEGDDVTFRCRLDDEPVEVCPKRTSFGRVEPGKHSIRVRAIDPAGNIQERRKKASFTVLP